MRPRLPRSVSVAARWAAWVLLPVAVAATLRAEEVAGPFRTSVPPSPGNVILGRPTGGSVTASALWAQGARVRLACAPRGEALQTRPEVILLPAGEPREVLIDALRPDTPYEYRFLDADTGAPLLPVEGNGSFHTCRPPGAPYTFTVTADPHLDEFTDLELYRSAMGNILVSAPDFHIDLGDTFMTGKHPDRESAARQYAAQRYWFGLIGGRTPLFLALGNHDGEEAFRPGAADPGGLALWSLAQRKRLFPNPAPSPFYAGDATPHPLGGELQDYYAWTWGDALFVVLDPYWRSGFTRGGREPWNMTLGREQYDWLARTLRGSTARHKLVFIHQLTGGLDASARGGAEAAMLYEWGGRDAAGKDDFAARRPGWEKPVHALLVETGVGIVFHGHDHFFARQALDGVIYQLVPQPAHRNCRNHQAAEYGYRQGDFLPNSGHLRVSVAPDRLTVDYVRTADESMARRGLQNGHVSFTYNRPAPRARP